ncbi:MAG TPA: serine/threonine-protein kinase, partial [Candidatus Dormibacteraeota bacterium]
GARRDQLLREARVAARLRHRNVVAVHDCGIATDGTPYIVMEYVVGPSLAERLRRGVPAPAETLHVAEQLAAALDHAHALAVVHRDVKPANVLLGDDGVVRLGDFGIAQAGLEPESGELWAGLGTPAYMAPEQALGQRCGARTDVYGLAAVLYEMLTGRTPHGEGGVASSGLPGAAPAPRAVNPYLPVAVDAVLARGLARDPARRPASAGRLVAALAAAVRETPRSMPLGRRPSRMAVLLGGWRR